MTTRRPYVFVATAALGLVAVVAFGAGTVPSLTWPRSSDTGEVRDPSLAPYWPPPNQ
jgi:hypothetical protein